MFKSKITTIIAVTALVVAVLGATPLGQAASRLVLPKNSVGAVQIKKSAVGSKKIAKNAITSPKVKDGSLLAADFKAGQLPAGPKGDPGAQGPKGDKGVPGAAGSAVAFAHVVVTAGGATVDTSRAKNVTPANVTRRSQGITCISGLSFAPKSVTVTTDAETGNGIYNATAVLAPDVGVVSLCGVNGQAAVITGQGYNAYDTSYYIDFN